MVLLNTLNSNAWYETEKTLSNIEFLKIKILRHKNNALRMKEIKER